MTEEMQPCGVETLKSLCRLESLRADPKPELCDCTLWWDNGDRIWRVGFRDAEAGPDRGQYLHHRHRNRSSAQPAFYAGSGIPRSKGVRGLTRVNVLSGDARYFSHGIRRPVLKVQHADAIRRGQGGPRA